MIYGIKLYNKIKVFSTQNPKTTEHIVNQHKLIYKKDFTNSDVYTFKFIPSEIISGNYLIFNCDEDIDSKINKICKIGDIYEDFGLLRDTSVVKKQTSLLAPYENTQSSCEVKDSTKLILDNNMVKLNIYYSKETMKVYYKNIDSIEDYKLDIELFPELELVGPFEFKMSFKNLSEKLLEKYYYSIDQVKLAVQNLTLNDSRVLTNENLINVFHQYFTFDGQTKCFSLDDILDSMTLTISEKDVREFYRLALKYYLSKNNVQVDDNKYKLSVKIPFIKIPKQKPIDEIELNNMVNQKIKERSEN